MINRAKFMAEILRFATAGIDPDAIINKALEFMATQLNADRAYIFEEVSPGIFDNTYEYCAEGAVPQIDNLKNIPYEDVVKPWYDEYRENKNIFIEDLEEYKNVCLPMYEVLKPQDIQTLISGPIALNGEYCGFFGVDNPPIEKMKEISSIVTLLQHSFSLMIRYRNDSLSLRKNSHEDDLTKIANRRAFSEYTEELEKAGIPENLVFVALDVNGLKFVNDNQGHEAGDELLKGAADVIKESFGCYGEIYRLGGDEFAALIFVNENELERIIETFLDNCFNWKGDTVDSLSVSYGYASGAETLDGGFKAIINIADKRMYKNKADYYAKAGIDRRGQQDAYNALCDAYGKILKVDLTRDIFSVIKMDWDTEDHEVGYEICFSQWLSDFIKSGGIRRDSVEKFNILSDTKGLRDYFNEGNKILTIFYNRRISGKYKHALLEMIPDKTYSDDNQIVYVYIKDIEK